jgi:hypothetical protein
MVPGNRTSTLGDTIMESTSRLSRRAVLMPVALACLLGAGSAALADASGGPEQRRNDTIADAAGGSEQRRNDTVAMSSDPEHRRGDTIADAAGGPEQRRNDTVAMRGGVGLV